MPTNKYTKPKGKVTQVSRGKEVEDFVLKALQSVFPSNQQIISKRKVKNFLRILAGQAGGGETVLIFEKYPLNSFKASGKIGKTVHVHIGKTGTNYTKDLKKPHNPKTPLQQANRQKLAGVAAAWRALPSEQKDFWNKKAENKPKSGYNLFSSNYLLNL